MALYELRTYSIYVGKFGDVVALYRELGWPAMEKGGHAKKLVGYFTSDTGELNQLIHLWKFDDDADRRAFWAGVLADDDFMAFAAKIRPLIMKQRNKLLREAPWGPHP